MSNLNDAGFNGYTFLENLPNIDIDNNLLNQNYVKQETVSSATGQAAAGMATQATSGTGTVDGFFSLFSTAGQRLPGTYDDFVKAFDTYLGIAPSNPQSGPIFEGFVSEFRALLGIGGGSGSPLGGDWAALASVVSPADIQQQFVKTFSEFIRNYTYPPTVQPTYDNANPPNLITPGDNGVLNKTDFFNNWYKFMSTTATIEPLYPQIASYRKIYEGFGFPPGEFQNRLIEFYNQKIAETRRNSPPAPADGYFIPSRSVSDWFETMLKDYEIQQNNAFASVVTSVSGSNGKRAIILVRLFKLLVNMIDSIQKVAAAQAQGLNYLTEWQKAYVERMNQIRTFTASDGTRVQKRDATSDEAQDRDELNKKNSAYTETLRANRDLISDDAKALQSNVNQSNDAVTQQANLATSILQQFSSILGSIFR